MKIFSGTLGMVLLLAIGYVVGRKFPNALPSVGGF